MPDVVREDSRVVAGTVGGVSVADVVVMDASGDAGVVVSDVVVSLVTVGGVALVGGGYTLLTLGTFGFSEFCVESLRCVVSVPVEWRLVVSSLVGSSVVSGVKTEVPRVVVSGVRSDVPVRVVPSVVGADVVGRLLQKVVLSGGGIEEVVVSSVVVGFNVVVVVELSWIFGTEVVESGSGELVPISVDGVVTLVVVATVVVVAPEVVVELSEDVAMEVLVTSSVVVYLGVGSVAVDWVVRFAVVDSALIEGGVVGSGVVDSLAVD